MKLRPTIFLSGVSSEFRSFREAAEIEVQKKGCFPINQPSFGVDYREIAEILRTKLIEADALVHIVGFRFGFEPQNPPAGASRRSYTQMEYDIARELGKPIYVFLSSDANVRDSDGPPEDAEAIEFQLAHRRSITERSDNIHYSFKNTNELCNLVAGIPLLATADFRVDISRIDRYAPAELIGREDELALLDNAWLKVRRSESKRPHVLTFVALGGEGKTSLVAKWLANLAYDNWPGCDSAFAWSFYSQGSHEQSAASSDLFLKEAISFFGNDADREFAASNAGAYEKGQLLACIVGQRRALLILDGLEPLQYAPTSQTAGDLKDLGIAALLKGLAVDNSGLSVVTTRYSVPNLKAYWQTTAPENSLTRMSLEAGVHFLKTLKVKGSTKELETLVEDVKGHALTLNLLGTFLRDAHGGDIRRRDLVKLEEANSEEQGGHAFRVMEAYEQAFENEGDKGKRAIAILRLLGLFDRSVDANCLDALLTEPSIKGLTDALVGVSTAQRNIILKRLEDARLFTVKREPSGDLVSVDAHPLLREYFARQLRIKHPEAWRIAHQRLYEHLSAIALDDPEPSLEQLQPLYQAIAHGCQGSLQQKVFDEIYIPRITRGGKFYNLKKLGAFASDLGAIAWFFETPWSRVSPALAESDQLSLLSVAAFDLNALGRLTEALEPMRTTGLASLEKGDWLAAAVSYTNLGQLELTLGKVSQSRLDAKQSVTYADRSGNIFQQTVNRCGYANVLHQAGSKSEAETLFREAEQLHTAWESESPLYGLQGFVYCDLVLGPAERAAWQRTMHLRDLSLVIGETSDSNSTALVSNILQIVFDRTTKTLAVAVNRNMSLLALAVDHLTLGRAALYEGVLTGSIQWPNGNDSMARIDGAVSNFRRAGTMHHLPRALLSRAWSRLLSGASFGIRSAKEDLDEAWEIAERGPMRLFMADIHLYRARLFFREQEYPWESAEADLKAARKLIEQCGYWRRKEELEDAERVILKKSVQDLR